MQGGIFSFGRHTQGTGFAKDLGKWNAAAARGWLLVYCIPGEHNKVQRTKVHRTVAWEVPALLNLDTARMVKAVVDARMRTRELIGAKP